LTSHATAAAARRFDRDQASVAMLGGSSLLRHLAIRDDPDRMLD